MIYYLTKHPKEEVSPIGDLEPTLLKDVINLLGAAKVPDSLKSQKIFRTKIADRFLTDQESEKISPSQGDVLIMEDRRFGIGAVVGTQKRSTGQVYDLILHEMVMEKFGPDKSYDRPEHE